MDGRCHACRPQPQREDLKFAIAHILDKLRESRLKWHSHVLRAEEDTICKAGVVLEVPRKRPKGWPNNGG
ncbi:hypothetical protein Y032_0001g202 [Ancylostoma ceylanicum]|uniref:Uncharacterized protein n=1 Tax=Ancylostoma ceylanicum TaxID=53326 RepID=A0A016W371_9BILA|nr:hypothetical protein Y032_0001g202 [Ancylostoma ceylanicum]